jgi:hypothetical protein
MSELKITLDPEQIVAEKWLKEKTITVPFVLDENGNKVYQLKFHPVLPPDNPIVYNRLNGLGNFHKWEYKTLREFLDDYLDISHILKLATVSKEWNYFCSDEKLWKRLVKRLKKGNVTFHYTWKHSLVIDHNTKTHFKNTGEAWVPYELVPPDRSRGPWYEGLDFECMRDFKRWRRASNNPLYFDLSCPKNQIDVVDCADLSVEEFIEKYEKLGKPVVIKGIAKSWTGYNTWTRECLLQNYAHSKFRTGSGFKMEFRNYMSYIKTQHEMQPLYLFDQNYPENAPQLLADYSVPKYFPEDLFSVVGEEDRPPYRWILVGPSGSGVPFHIDPRGTSAWNTVLHGKKRWAFYPPKSQPPGVGPHHKDYYNAPTAIKWYMKVLPTLSENNRPIECLQEEGDTIFVPSQWWHMVYNCGANADIVSAITQNYVSSQNLDRVMREIYEDTDSSDDFVDTFRKVIKKDQPAMYEKFVEVGKNYTRTFKSEASNSSGSRSSCTSSSSSSSESDG